jgi:RNA polymerase sigma factor (sigma-70 family)
MSQGDLSGSAETPRWDGLFPVPQGTTDPKEVLDREESILAIRKAIADLPEVYRTAVLLVDLEGLDYRTAAEVMKVPINTVRSRLARARDLLRQKLKPLL